jgi:hypothetical protein
VVVVGGEVAAGQLLQAVEQGRGVLPAVRLDQADHDVRAPGLAPVRLAEHGERLADPGRRAEVDPQLAALALAVHGPSVRAPVSRRGATPVLYAVLTVPRPRRVFTGSSTPRTTRRMAAKRYFGLPPFGS